MRGTERPAVVRAFPVIGIVRHRTYIAFRADARLRAMNERLAWFVVACVAGVWTLTTLVLPVVIVGYSPPAGVGTVMGSIAGGAAAFLFARHNNKRDNGEPVRKVPPPKPDEEPRLPPVGPDGGRT